MNVDLYDVVQLAVTDGAALCDVLDALNLIGGERWLNGSNCTFVDLTVAVTSSGRDGTLPTTGERPTVSLGSR